MHGGVLVGDVGGTQTRFAMAGPQDWPTAISDVKVLAGRDFGGFDDALRHYLDTTGAAPDAACIAVAGPVRSGAVHLTNRDWAVSEADVSARFGIGRVILVNDFVAMARAVPELGQDAFDVLFAGEAVKGAPILVAGPGTGFGVSTLIPVGGGWTVLAGEGGHIAYAPRTDLERQLARILERDHGYVSNELVASGSGLDEVHAAFCEIYGVARAEFSPAEIIERAEAGDPMYRALIELRANAVMGAVGDLALANGTLGGVVLAGGVTERIAAYLKTPEVFGRFAARGPMSDFLACCPVRRLRDPLAPLTGAAAWFYQHEAR